MSIVPSSVLLVFTCAHNFCGVQGQIRVDLEKVGKLIGPHDLLIAAHAIAMDAALVTANVREFKRVKGLQVVNCSR
jgi:predicted nucleic acid-binding protein